MRAQAIEVRLSAGRMLCSTIFQPNGRKLLAKGHILRPEDIEMLAQEGLEEVWVTELESGEVGEDEAVLELARHAVAGAVEIRQAIGGRANIYATETGALVIKDDLLRYVNGTSSLAIATAPLFSYVKAGQRVASIKSTPFAVPASELEAAVRVLRERGPVATVRPIRKPRVAVLFTDPLHPDRAREAFGHITRQRLEHYGVPQWQSAGCEEDDQPLIRSFLHLLKPDPTVILVASTTAPAGPEDAVGRAMTAVGAQTERFLAPVEPGNLTLLGYRGNTPILSAPGCYRSTKANMLDLLLPPLLAGYRVSSWEIAGLGQGGLLGQ